MISLNIYCIGVDYLGNVGVIYILGLGDFIC